MIDEIPIQGYRGWTFTLRLNRHARTLNKKNRRKFNLYGNRRVRLFRRNVKVQAHKASKPYFKIKKTQSFFWLYAVLLFSNEFSTSEMRADNQVHLCTMNPPVFCPFYQVNSKYYT